MLSPEERDARLAALDAEQDRQVQEYGHAVQGVFGTETDPSFGYTIGLQDAGWPELIIVGLGYPNSGILLNDVVAHYRKLERAPAAGDVLTELGNWPLAVAPCGSAAVGEYLCRAGYRAERRGMPAPTALQLIYPDREGRWPTDADYDHDYMDPLQPCLAEDGQWVCPVERAVESQDAG